MINVSAASVYRGVSLHRQATPHPCLPQNPASFCTTCRISVVVFVQTPISRTSLVSTTIQRVNPTFPTAPPY